MMLTKDSFFSPVAVPKKKAFCLPWGEPEAAAAVHASINIDDPSGQAPPADESSEYIPTSPELASYPFSSVSSSSIEVRDQIRKLLELRL